MRKNKIIYFSFLLFLALSCHRKQSNGFDTDLLLPLANASIGFDKLIADSTARVNSDKSIDIVYRYPFYNYSLKDILKVPDTSVTVSAKLGTANLSNNLIQDKVTLGRIASSLGNTGLLIILLNGQNAVIPAIPPTAANQPTDIDATSFFQEADITSGFMDLSIYNDLPIPMSDFEFNVKNKVGGQMVVSDTFSYIAPGATVTRSYDLSGKHLEGLMVGSIVTIGSPGSGGVPVLIDTSKALTMQMKVRGLTASHAIARFPKQDLIVVNDTIVYDLGKAQLNKMIIRSGKVKMQMYSTLQDTLYIDYKIPSAIKNGDTVHMFLKVPPATIGGVQNVTQEVDLAGYTINLQGRSGVSHNAFWNIFRASIDSTGKLMPLSNKDSVWIRYGLFDIIPQFAEGYLGQDTQSVGPTQTIIDAFSKVVSGNIDLKDISVSLGVDNGIGADASITVDYLTSKNSRKGSTLQLTSTLLSNPFVISRANRSGNYAVPKSSSLDFTTSNSNLKPFVENLPDLVNYKFTAKLNPNGNAGYTDFIDYDSKLSASLDIKMPLAFKSSQLSLCDTVSVNLGSIKTNLNEIDKGKLNFIFDNNFPVSFNVKLYFLNDLNQVIDSVFEGYGALITAAPLDQSSLRTIGSSKSVLSTNMDAARYNLLRRSTKVILKATINSSGSNYIKFYSDYKLKFILSGEFTYHAGKR